MIKLKNILNEIYKDDIIPIKSGEVVYHGRLDPTDKFNEYRPAFFTRLAKDAYFYSTRGSGKPTMIKATLSFKKSANYKIVKNISKKLNITDDELSKCGGYSENYIDDLYVPRLLKMLEGLGYDSYIGVDTLYNNEIPILCVWHKNRINIIKKVIFKLGKYY